MLENQNTQYALSIDLVKSIPFKEYEQNFTFIVNNKEYQTSRIIADILSPKICQYHSIDKTIDTFKIDIDYQTNNFDFYDFLSLISFQPREFSQEQIEYFRNIFLILDNKTEYLKLCPKFQGDITINNVFERLQAKRKYVKNYLDSEHIIELQEIEFISSHFFEIDLSQVKTLGKNIIEQILKNKNLKLKDEDSLMKFIIDIYSEDQTCSTLFNYVYFTNVSVDEMRHFYGIFDFNDINNEIWRSINERILNSTVNLEQNESDQMKERYNAKQFLFEEEKKFEGIINYLTKSTGGNIHDNGTIEISSNSVAEHPKNLLDFNNNNYYCASNRWDVWVCYDFKEKMVNITDYSINSIKGDSGHHLRSWVIEISNDQKDWKIIDQQNDCQKLNGTDLNATFKTQPNKFSRYVRLRNTAEPYGGNSLWFHSIEFYGYLRE